MRSRSRLHLVVLALLVGAAAACTDESPLLTGDPFFPDGRPVTLEAILPASEFLQLRGVFTGYTQSRHATYAVIANSFDGGVDARALLRFPTPYPRELEYSQDGSTRRDTAYTIVGVEVVLEVDSSASVSTPVPLTLHPLAEAWEDSVVSWQVRARDSTGTHLWTQPGGTFGAAIGAGTYTPADSASRVVLTVDAGAVEALRDSAFPGLLVQSPQPNTRMEITDAQLRIQVRPSNAVRDTTIFITRDVEPEDFAFIYTPEPPTPPGFIQAGGILSTRTLFSMDLPDSVEACTPTCTRYALADLALNQVSLMLRPRAAGGGFRLLDSATVGLRVISEPELGRLAPLGDHVVGGFDPRGRPVAALGSYAAADTVVEIPFTIHAARLIRGDTVPADFALIGFTASPLPQVPFSLLLFDPEPRLRIVFTVPERPRLP